VMTKRVGVTLRTAGQRQSCGRQAGRGSTWFGRSRVYRERLPARALATRSVTSTYRGGESRTRSQVRTGLAAGGRWIRTSGSPTDPPRFRESGHFSHDGLTVSRPGTGSSNPSPSSGESLANSTDGFGGPSGAIVGTGVGAANAQNAAGYHQRASFRGPSLPQMTDPVASLLLQTPEFCCRRTQWIATRFLIMHRFLGTKGAIFGGRNGFLLASRERLLV
jgi:hypothetical protein